MIDGLCSLEEGSYGYGILGLWGKVYVDHRVSDVSSIWIGDGSS